MVDEITTTLPGKTSTHRKINKLMMEKRRRTRINNCLVELKTLVLKALKKDGEQFSKLEKVDILEMTVKYLRFLHQQSQINITTDSLGSKYRLPMDVSAEVIQYMNSEEVRSRLTDPLSKCSRVPSTSPSTMGPASPPTPMPAHQQPQQLPIHRGVDPVRHGAHQLGGVFIKNTGHLMVPISTKHSENSLMIATSESSYKSLTVPYVSAPSASPTPSTSAAHSTQHVVSTRVPSVSAISPANSPTLLQMKTLVTENSVAGGCYVSAVPLYLGTMNTASHLAPTLSGYYTSQSPKTNNVQENEENLPVWRPW